MIEQIGHDNKNDDELYLINQLGSKIDYTKTGGSCLKSMDAIDQGKAKGCKKWHKAFSNQFYKEIKSIEKECL